MEGSHPSGLAIFKQLCVPSHPSFPWNCRASAYVLCRGMCNYTSTSTYLLACSSGRTEAQTGSDGPLMYPHWPTAALSVSLLRCEVASCHSFPPPPFFFKILTKELYPANNIFSYFLGQKKTCSNHRLSITSDSCFRYAVSLRNACPSFMTIQAASLWT